MGKRYMDRRYMVKQRIGQWTNHRGQEFALYETGDSKWVLLDPMIPMGSPGTFASSCSQFPYEKKRMPKGWRNQVH